MEKTVQDRRHIRRLVLLTAVACLVLLAAVVPSPYAIERPGPVVDTLGEVEIEGETMPVLSIADAETFPTEGVLNLLTVSIVGSPDNPTGWLSLVPALLDPSQRVAPLSEFFPEGVSEKDREASSAIMMDTSQMQSAAAAFRQLGMEVKVTLTVAGVSEDGPAASVLKEGDTLVAVNGTPVRDFQELRNAVKANGEKPASLTIIRKKEKMQVEVTPRVPPGGSEALLGAMVSSKYDLPAKVDISLSRIGGPSAGLVFSLGVYDRLTRGSLLDGLTVSGTGTMSDAGQVGAIGGLTQKMWAAERAGSDLFLMPVENCGDIPDRLPGNMTIAPVNTLDEAIQAIEKTTRGEKPAGIERCSG